MERDPICGMNVDPKTAKYTALHEGRTFYFCGSGCKKIFEAEPHRYAQPKR